MKIVHLTASPFFGGPERQMLGLAQHLPAGYRSHFLSFPERGLCRPFLEQLRAHGIGADALTSNTPRFFAAVREVATRLADLHADVLCCHGYKADLVGLAAARRRGVPVVAVARGWTAVSWKVRVYEALDRRGLAWMDAVVCVSEGQARKVREAGVPDARVRVIRNAIRADRFDPADGGGRAFLLAFYKTPRRHLVGAVGRLSPEKGFTHLVDAAAEVVRAHPDTGFVVFGDGPLRDELTRQIEARGLAGSFVLAGFRTDVDRWLPAFDVTVLPSYTEGLPNAVLESLAAGVPAVATAVGGTPEVIDDGRTGYLVEPGTAAPLARRVGELLADDGWRRLMGERGRRRVRTDFTFAAQARQYAELFDRLVPAAQPAAPAAAVPAPDIARSA
jgi:glycosyltransferase involved in cell wall biosynthesis